MKLKIITILFFFIQLINAQTAFYIDTGDNDGVGTFEDPFNSFVTAFDSTDAGDTLFIMPGDYYQSARISIFNKGSDDAITTIRGYDVNDWPVIHGVTDNQTFRLIGCINYRLEYIEIVGDFTNPAFLWMQAGDTSCRDITLYKLKIHQGHQAGVYVYETDNLVIDSCEIFDMINYDGGVRKDAHGILYNSGRKITVTNCEIYYCTGDGLQCGATVNFPVWDTAIIKNCEIYGGQFDTVHAGVPAGIWVGENSIDFKTPDSLQIDTMDADYRGYVYAENLHIHHFNMDNSTSALGIAYKIDATYKNCIVHDCSRAFGVTGSYYNEVIEGVAEAPYLKLINCLSYNTYYVTMIAYREPDSFRVWNCTFINNIDTAMYGTPPEHFDTRSELTDNCEFKNCIFVDDDSVTVLSYIDGIQEAIHWGDQYDFVDMDGGDMRLIKTSGAIDAGVNIDSVLFDLNYIDRTEDEYDIGAYEYNGEVYPARYPYPADGDTGVRYNVVTSWGGTDSSIVYFSFDETVDTNDFKIKIDSTSYDPLLIYEQYYYWRVDIHDSDNDTTITGDVWSFATPERIEDTVTTVVQLNFQDNTADDVYRFNSIDENGSYTSLLDSTGASSDIYITTGNFQGYSNTAGYNSGDNSCFFIDSVMVSYLYKSPGNSSTLGIGGINCTNLELQMLGSVTQNGRYLYADLDGDTGVLYGQYNCDSIAYFSIDNPSSSIDIDLFTTAYYGYINGMRIIENISDYEFFAPYLVSPADEAVGVNTSATLNVYSLDTVYWFFSTDETIDTTDYVSKGVELSIDPGELSNNTTYYWQTKVSNGDGWLEGEQWSFSTRNPTNNNIRIGGQEKNVLLNGINRNIRK